MTDAEKNPRVFHVMGACINQNFGEQSQSIRMCIEVHAGNVNFGGATEMAIEYSAYEQAQDKIKHLEERVEKLLEALEFYGDREETRESFDQLDLDLVNNKAAYQDRGKRARAALKEDGESK